MLTPAGTNMRRGVGAEELVQWNDFGVQDLVGRLYPLFLMDLHRYLVTEGEAPNRVLGEGVEFSVDARRYERAVKVSFDAQPDLTARRGKDGPKPQEYEVRMGEYTVILTDIDDSSKKPKLADALADYTDLADPMRSLATLPLTVKEYVPQAEAANIRRKLEEAGGKVTVRKLDQFGYVLPEAARRRPGVYRFVLTALGEGPADDRQETKAYAYNVDAQAESDLKRAPTERITPDPIPTDSRSGKFKFTAFTSAPPTFQEKQPDASESPWLYLFFILILVVEQAMAVHLSYHLKGSEAPAPSAQPASA
jgi:hypothetical protein